MGATGLLTGVATVAGVGELTGVATNTAGVGVIAGLDDSIDEVGPGLDSVFNTGVVGAAAIGGEADTNSDGLDTAEIVAGCGVWVASTT